MLEGDVLLPAHPEDLGVGVRPGHPKEIGELCYREEGFLRLLPMEAEQLSAAFDAGVEIVLDHGDTSLFKRFNSLHVEKQVDGLDGTVGSVSLVPQGLKLALVGRDFQISDGTLQIGGLAVPEEDEGATCAPASVFIQANVAIAKVPFVGCEGIRGSDVTDVVLFLSL
ncbi:hypothetical protein EYF80_061222 [Liparis tanakae]|uniref:Uncharacterized protein n=1 Tax=Liparis tanakae TaxID=230148 RepID=A0A4Z2EIK0_9TELE|nr:hypothetical protein EYF80_061222 [Liparis tanakae]